MIIALKNMVLVVVSTRAREVILDLVARAMVSRKKMSTIYRYELPVTAQKCRRHTCVVPITVVRIVQ